VYWPGSEAPFERVAMRVARAVWRAERPGRTLRVEAVPHSLSGGLVAVSDETDSGRRVVAPVSRGRLPPGFRAELDAFHAGP
jgi:hypothetical protein